MPRRHDLELFLKQSELFQRLSAKQRQGLAVLCREKRFAKGETIFHEGRPAENVWLTLEGRVHLLHHLPDGRAQANCVMTPGETFCCLPALDWGLYPVTAVAATQARILQIPLSSFHKLMSESPALLQDTLCLFGNRLRQIEAKGCMVHDPVERRIAQTLLTLEKKFEENIPLTRQEVAELAGTTVETVIRTMARFQREGWVQSTRGKIRLLKPDLLKQILL